jgi:hypothetical protein
METILLADDERIFKAVEGTCLRRERCRLLKAPSERLLDVALERPPDLILACLSDDASRSALRRICAEGALASVPIVVLDFGPGARKAKRPPVRLARRIAPVEMVSAPGSNLDARLDAAIKRTLPVLNRADDRVSVSVPVRCRAEGAAFTVRTKNISPTGLFLKTEKPLARGERFAISFSLPADTDNRGAARTGVGGFGRRAADAGAPISNRISGVCEVVRQVARGPRGEYDDLIPGMGVRFVKIAPQASSTLQRFARGGAVRSRRAGCAVRRTHSSH